MYGLRSIRSIHEQELMQKENVVGVGIGQKVSDGRVVGGEDVITVLVEKKVPISTLSTRDIVPWKIAGAYTDVVEVGKLVALANTTKYRPAPGGVSLGHFAITAGTLGVVVRDRSTGERLILSNNHVLADSNSAKIGDEILQPGPYDGGTLANDIIGHLLRFVPIIFDGAEEDPTCPIANSVVGVANVAARLLGRQHRLQAVKPQQATNLFDAALALPISDDVVSDEILEIGLVDGVYPNPELGLAVKKSGRTTELTHDNILVVNATVKVGYGAGQTATFTEQLIAGPMSQGGDSGSLVVTEDGNHVVGLLFAGSDQTTVFSPIQPVLDLLNIEV